MVAIFCLQDLDSHDRPTPRKQQCPLLEVFVLLDHDQKRFLDGIFGGGIVTHQFTLRQGTFLDTRFADFGNRMSTIRRRFPLASQGKRRQGRSTSTQFPKNLITDFTKCALKRVRELHAGDATNVAKE